MSKIRAWFYMVVGLFVGLTQAASMAGVPLATGGTITNYTENGTAYIAHIFTEDGQFVPERELGVEYLIVAGGGGGGGANFQPRAGGGGGAGGRLSGFEKLAVISYSVVVGEGGAGGNNNGGTQGQNSSAFGLAAIGGGRGAGNSGDVGGAGGSGGGSRSGYTTAGGEGTDGQGYDGSAGAGTQAGGGGGAGGAGTAPTGGLGVESAMTGSLLTYAEGGDGGDNSQTNSHGTAAGPNTGSGGTGGQRSVNDGTVYMGGDGGSGIVVIRYAREAIYDLSATDILASSADLQGSLNAADLAVTVTAYWSTSNNVDAAAWEADGTKQSASAGSFEDVMAQPLSVEATGLTAETTYYYTFRAENGTAGIDFWAPTASFLTFPTIAAPVVENLGATDIGVGTATLRGNLTAGGLADAYFVWDDGDQGAASTGDWANVSSLIQTTELEDEFSLAVSDLLYGVAYAYRIYATNDDGTAWSAVETFTTSFGGGDVISALSAANITDTTADLQATLDATEAVFTVTGYLSMSNNVDAAAWEGDSTAVSDEIGTFTNVTTQVSMNATGLEADTMYYYTFRSENASENVWGLSSSFPSALTAAQNPAFTAVEATSSGTLLSVSLAWTDNAATETAYVLQRSSSGSTGPYDVVATLPSNSTSHVDYVMPSTTYHYRLFATNSVNATSTDPAACQSDAITTISVVVMATGGNRFSIYKENGTNYVAHIFTEAGTFEPRKALDVDYLVVAGGGGGGGAYWGKEGGGGGAGGLLAGTTNLTVNSYGVVVGGGGGGGAGSSSGVGADGQPSSAFDEGVSTIGGGGGGANTGGGRAGGSGGGGAASDPPPPGGAGEAGPPRQGHDGGLGATSNAAAAGGGGGALEAGSAGTAGGSGGAGATSPITGTSLTYAQGGNGGVQPASGNVDGTNAVANTGSGGEGGAAFAGNGTGIAAGGAGGSGIVVIRYQVPPSGTVLIVR